MAEVKTKDTDLLLPAKGNNEDIQRGVCTGVNNDKLFDDASMSDHEASYQRMAPASCLQRRRTWVLLFVATVVTLAIYVAVFTEKLNAQPHIVFIFADDMGLGDIGYNNELATRGSFPSAILDGLAHEGTKFTNFYTHSICTPSRVAVMTGRFPSRTNLKTAMGGLTFAHALDESEELLPEVLKALGYRTHMVGKWHIGHHERKYTPVARGFDSYFGNFQMGIDYLYHNSLAGPPMGEGKADRPHLPVTYVPHDFVSSRRADKADSVYTCPEGVDCNSSTNCPLVADGYHDDDLTTSDIMYEVHMAQPMEASETPDEATDGEFYATNVYGSKNVEVIKQHDPGDGPLFLYAAFTAPHNPLQALEEDFEACDPMEFTDTDRMVLCAMVQAFDRNVGEIVDALSTKGMWEHTVLVFASDNGAPFSQGGDNGPLRGQKATLYNGGIKTPAFIRFGENTVPQASTTRGIENHQAVHAVDFFATMIGAASQDGAQDPRFQNEIDGRNLWTQVSSGASIPSHLSSVNFSIAAGPGFSTPRDGPPGNIDETYSEAVIATFGGKEFKLCRNCNRTEMDEIFDLTTDPYETTNLANQAAFVEVAAFLEGVLARWVDLASPEYQYPTILERAGEVLRDGGIDPALAKHLVQEQRCLLPLDSPEFVCSDCSQLRRHFPETIAPIDTASHPEVEMEDDIAD